MTFSTQPKTAAKAAFLVAKKRPQTPRIPSSATIADAFAATFAAHRGVFLTGRLGLRLDLHGRPQRMGYFDPEGRLLGQSRFEAATILRCLQKYHIDPHELRRLGDQLDAAGVCYRPYEMDAEGRGVDFDDLLAVDSLSQPIDLGFPFH